MKNNTVISFEGVSKKYFDTNGEIKALENISFNIFDKEFVSIIGPSGCGKSTILSLISRIDNHYDGVIKYKKNLKIGYMLQNDCLFPWRTILDNCLIGLEINNCCTNENIEYVKSLLKKYGLIDFIDKYPRSLSGGMKQRVALIRTLALKPDVLLLDEPLSALDSSSRINIGMDILNIIKNENKTAIMVTHDISEALSISDRIFLLSSRPGRIKSVYSVNLEGNYMERRTLPEFQTLYNTIWRDFNESSS